MMLTNDLYLSFVVTLFPLLTSAEAIRLPSNNTIINQHLNDTLTINGNGSIAATSMKDRLDHSKEIIQDVFANMDQGTLIRGIIVIGGITCLILMYIGIKTCLVRKKRQPKRYKLITDPSSMEEPLFGAHDDEDDEVEDDTLFSRK